MQRHWCGVVCSLGNPAALTRLQGLALRGGLSRVEGPLAFATPGQLAGALGVNPPRPARPDLLAPVALYVTGR